MKIAKMLDELVGKIERAEVLDRPAEAIAKVGKAVLGAKAVTDVTSGTPIAHPAHPLFVAVPIGSWVSAGLFDLARDPRGAQRLTGIGLLSALPSAVTGMRDWTYTDGGERRVGLVHAVINWVAIATYGASWLARRSGRQGTGVVLSLAGASALSAAGWLGGHLAYALGVGVDTTAFQHSAEEWEPVAAEDDVRFGELTGGDCDGVPVVLTRTADGKVVVLADRCTHRGAPLHEGELIDGCVVCPWHGSEFALDGSVVHGPATRPQKAYEVGSQGGQIVVRRTDEPRSLRTNPVGR